MPSNLDLLVLDSNTPAFINKESGSFTISLSGTVSSGATRTWSGSVNFTDTTGYIRYTMTQDVVPAVAPYTNADAVPLALLVGGSTFSPFVTTSGPATSIAPNIYLSSTASSATVTISIFNPYASTLTVTNTAMTVHYTPFLASIS